VADDDDNGGDVGDGDLVNLSSVSPALKHLRQHDITAERKRCSV